MDLEERYQLITRNVQELTTGEELRALLAKEDYQPTAYIGFEPSGLVHMGWALVASKIKDLCDAGVKVIIFWADWHAYINDKLGGDIENIRICARYFEDCFIALGVPREKVEFRYAYELLDDINYWEKVIKIAKVTSLSRVKRAMTIMGRSENEADLDSSKLFYPILQAADMFHLNVDISYAGLDQRRANMLARDAADKLGWKKPIAIHTPLLPGLKGGQRMDPAQLKEKDADIDTSFKMSKSDPNSSLRIHDSPDDIRRKMKKAFCPMEKEDESINPVLMICKSIIFPKLGKMEIVFPEKFGGGSVVYNSYEELSEAYFSGKLFPSDLKSGTADGMIKCLEPVQKYFEEHPENYQAMQEVLKKLGRL
ncbi:MAG: tyrosine--tRNA ligase [Candidatus Methanomethylophilaceae archaeon]|nr:tyrosine--tRNA ligase [Candidatus Methanomethylophilaceae archaeon]